MFVGIPSLWSLPLTKYMLPKDGTGAGAHGAYSAIIPLDGEVMVEWYRCAEKVYQAEGFDAMTDFFMHARHAVFVCMLCFDKTNKKQCEGIERIFHKLFQEGKKRGFSKYRAHVNHMGQYMGFMGLLGVTRLILFVQTWYQIRTISTTMRIAVFWKRSKTRWIRMESYRLERWEYGRRSIVI